jgi:hypothetical protein
MTATYGKDNLPSDAFAWKDYRKLGTTRMVSLIGPFTVITKEGPYTLPPDWIGYLAVDADGYPYPIEADHGGLPLSYERAS